MKLEQALEIRRGITAMIGGGGKTSLLRILGKELAGQEHMVHRLITAGAPLPGTGAVGARDNSRPDRSQRAVYFSFKAR